MSLSKYQDPVFPLHVEVVDWLGLYLPIVWEFNSWDVFTARMCSAGTDYKESLEGK